MTLSGHQGEPRSCPIRGLLGHAGNQRKVTNKKVDKLGAKGREAGASHAHVPHRLGELEQVVGILSLCDGCRVRQHLKLAIAKVVQLTEVLIASGGVGAVVDMASRQ